jgi:hypothetical protein
MRLRRYSVQTPQGYVVARCFTRTGAEIELHNIARDYFYFEARIVKEPFLR